MVTVPSQARPATTERDGLELLAAAGISVPRWRYLERGAAVRPTDIVDLRSDRVVVKVVAPSIVHKTEIGGVAFVDRKIAEIERAIAAMTARLEAVDVDGFLIEELIAHDAGIGGELLVTLRWTRDFGCVVIVGTGGIHAEALGRDLRPGRDVAIVASDVDDPGAIAAALGRATVVRLATEPQRGRPPRLRIGALVDVVARLLALGARAMPAELRELEINPMVVADGRLVALDVLLKRATGDELRLPPAVGRATLAAVPRPAARAARLGRLARLLEPDSIAIVGVSAGENVGRTILRNTLRAGFDPARLTVIKPGATEIDGCRCVPDLASLPSPVDLLVVAVSASAAAEVVPDAVERSAARSIIVIPGGLEETADGLRHAERIRAALDAARSRGDAPVILGGNCMGIRSRPGRYDTLFIPDAKLEGANPNRRSGAGPDPGEALALVAQSGAFAISRLSRLAALNPKHVITVGNQLDLTTGDVLEHLAADSGVRVVGVYVEGFAPLDGLRFLAAARAIRDRGGVVVLYRGGRTAAGATASASHTAAIAGDAIVSERLAAAAGVIVADEVARFDDLVSTFVRLDGRAVTGRRLAAVTNAGFECVEIGDASTTLEIAPFDGRTIGLLDGVLRRARLEGIVDVHNPMDLTPMAGDEAFADVAEAILASPGVDCAVIGNVPFTTALRTLPTEGFAEPGSVASRLVDLWHRTTKPWVTVVDAGPRYDAVAAFLAEAGIPTFRTADAAVRALERFVSHRLAERVSSPSPAPAGDE